MNNDGLGEYQSSSIYLKVGETKDLVTQKQVGRVIRTYKVPTEGAVERLDKNGNKVWDKGYPFFTGTLVAIETKMATEYGDKIIFKFVTNDGTSYTFDTSLYGSLADRLLKTLPNIDVTQKITIAPWLGDDEKLLITIKQGDTVIKPFYTKEDSKGLPNWVKVLKADGTPLITNGKETWDKSACFDFLLGMVEREIRPKLGSNSAYMSNGTISGETTATGAVLGENDTMVNHDEDPF